MGTKNEPRQPNGERYDYNSLCLAPRDQLEDIVRKGVTPSMGALVGWEFKGYVVNDLAEVIGGRKFKQGFCLDEPRREPELGIAGYHVMVHANTLGEPWIDKTKRGEPIRHSWCEVYPVSLSEIDNKYPHALLLNYALSSKNKALHPCRARRDYLVQVYADHPDLLLGKAYAALGRLRRELTFFVLERHNERVL